MDEKRRGQGINDYAVRRETGDSQGFAVFKRFHSVPICEGSILWASLGWQLMLILQLGDLCRLRLSGLDGLVAKR